MQQVILVDELDQERGIAEKMQAHREGWLHRAFSIFVFDSGGRMLLQQRSRDKYHSGGLWTNACCSHPVPGETLMNAAQRRLQEEMGFCIPLSKVFDFVYEAGMDNGLTEHEFDHVYVGEYEGPVLANRDEVMDHAFLEMEELRVSLDQRPGAYTAWFRMAYPRIEHWWKEHYKK